MTDDRETFNDWCRSVGGDVLYEGEYGDPVCHVGNIVIINDDLNNQFTIVDEKGNGITIGPDRDGVLTFNKSDYPPEQVEDEFLQEK